MPTMINIFNATGAPLYLQGQLVRGISRPRTKPPQPVAVEDVVGVPVVEYRVLGGEALQDILEWSVQGVRHDDGVILDANVASMFTPYLKRVYTVDASTTVDVSTGWGWAADRVEITRLRRLR